MPTARRTSAPVTRLRAAEAVRRSHARKVLHLDPIITMNAGGVIQSASDSVEQVFGWTPTELFGRNVKVLIPEPRRSSLDRYLDRYRNADSTSSLTRTQRFDAVRKDGTGIRIELSMSRADLPLHVAPFFIGIVREVSGEIDVGTDIRSERARLQHLVTEQTRALATANLRLQFADRLAALGTLAAGLGHDMNNVLLPVRARLNAIEHAGITASAQTHLEAVRQSIAYLQHLSDALHFLALDPEGADASDGDESSSVTDLNAWWRQVGALLRKAVPKHVTVRVQFPATLPPVRIAPHWLTQAALNLIVNAGEAIPVTKSAATVWLRATTADDGATVRLAVSDTGRGMSAATQRRAFDLFFTTKSRSMGTGLGLPLARKVAVRAGGDVELRSEAKRGTTATLVLPAAIALPASTKGGQPFRRQARISVRQHRTAALLAQVLISAHVTVVAGRAESPGKVDVWLTDPTRVALAVAGRWRKRFPKRSILLVGAPPVRDRVAWQRLGAAIIDPADDITAMRHALGTALGPSAASSGTETP
jgi:PAS domain S-box-containing protein